MDKSLSVPVQLLLIGAGGLAVIAGPVLYLLPHDTAKYFAWTIKHPLTPVFMGGVLLCRHWQLLGTAHRPLVAGSRPITSHHSVRDYATIGDAAALVHL